MKRIVISILVLATILLLAGPITAVASPDRKPEIVAGGGFIPSMTLEGNAFFKFYAMNQNDIIKGSLTYNDDGWDLQSTEITGLEILSDTYAKIYGNAIFNNEEGYTFTAFLSDNGGPGEDTFSIIVHNSDGYIVYIGRGTVQGGNIRILQ